MNTFKITQSYFRQVAEGEELKEIELTHEFTLIKPSRIVRNHAIVLLKLAQNRYSPEDLGNAIEEIIDTFVIAETTEEKEHVEAIKQDFLACTAFLEQFEPELETFFLSIEKQKN